MNEETVEKIKAYHRIEMDIREAINMVIKDSADFAEFQGWLDSIRKKQELLQQTITP